MHSYAHCWACYRCDVLEHVTLTQTINGIVKLVFFLVFKSLQFISKVSANEKKSYICSIFSNWLRTWPATDRRWALTDLETRCTDSTRMRGKGSLPNMWNRSTHLTHVSRDKMASIFQTTFSNTFSWMKIYGFRLRFHWSLFPTF